MAKKLAIIGAGNGLAQRPIHMVTYMWVTIGSGNDLLPDDAKPFSFVMTRPILITWAVFSKTFIINILLHMRQGETWGHDLETRFALLTLCNGRNMEQHEQAVGQRKELSAISYAMMLTWQSDKWVRFVLCVTIWVLGVMCYFGLQEIRFQIPWVRILHSAEEDNLSPFDSINNNKHV